MNDKRAIPTEVVTEVLSLDFTRTEAMFVRQMLDQVSVQGTQAMIQVLALTAKLDGALAKGKAG